MNNFTYDESKKGSDLKLWRGERTAPFGIGGGESRGRARSSYREGGNGKARVHLS